MMAKFMTPAVTAFRRDGSLDREANQRVYERLIAGGMDGIVVLGSTGEFFSMPVRQRKELAELAVEAVHGRVKVLVGTCSMCMEETVELTRHASDIGADGVILMSPYYFRLSQQSIERYYDLAVESSSIGVTLYNFPDRTGYDLSPQLVLNLLRRHRNLLGIKDTVQGISHTRALIEATRAEFPSFEVYSGFEENFTANVLSGGAGCIGGLSNFAPELFSSWVQAANAGDFKKVSEIQQRVNKLCEIYEVGTPFVPIVKKAMVLKGILQEDCCTEPLMHADERQTAEIKEILARVNLM